MAVVHARQRRYRFALNDKDRRGSGTRRDARLFEQFRGDPATNIGKYRLHGGDRD